MQSRKNQGLGPRERRRIGQLAVCLTLFGLVLLSRGNQAMEGLREELSTALRASPDWQASFETLNRDIVAGRPLGPTLQGFWAEILAPAREGTAPLSTGGGATYSLIRGDLLRGAPLQLTLSPAEHSEEMVDPLIDTSDRDGKLLEIPQEEPVTAEDPGVIHVDYSGPELPAGTTMDRYTLHLRETVSPVLAPLSSGFGWRVHPIEGGEKFHYGLDLVADVGTPVRAFADGVVEYIGESEVYGQYLQIDHADGVASFYAHCSELLVQPNQRVTAGETVALSGESGQVTGPHLHFELKRDGVRLNPIYYIETVS